MTTSKVIFVGINTDQFKLFRYLCFKTRYESNPDSESRESNQKEEEYPVSGCAFDLNVSPGRRQGPHSTILVNRAKCDNLHVLLLNNGQIFTWWFKLKPIYAQLECFFFFQILNIANHGVYSGIKQKRQFIVLCAKIYLLNNFLCY